MRCEKRSVFHNSTSGLSAHARSRFTLLFRYTGVDSVLWWPRISAISWMGVCCSIRVVPVCVEGSACQSFSFRKQEAVPCACVLQSFGANGLRQKKVQSGPYASETQTANQWQVGHFADNQSLPNQHLLKAANGQDARFWTVKTPDNFHSS